MKRYAYLIGANGPEQMRLKYAESDVVRLAEALKGGYCQFTAAKPVIANSRDEGLAHFQQFASQCEPSDTLLVHFSGHAIFDDQLFLICNTTDVNDLNTAIAIDAIKRGLRKCRAQYKLLILDCCHAKGAYDEDAFKGDEEIRNIIKYTAQGNALVILSACARKERTREFRELDGGSGFLSWAVRTACSTYFDKASSDPDKKTLSLTDVDHWVKKTLQEVNTRFNLQPPLPTPYLLRDQPVGHEIWLTAPREFDGKTSLAKNDENRRKYLEAVYRNYNAVSLPIGPSEGLSLHAIFQPLALRSDPLTANDLDHQRRRKLLGEFSKEVEDDSPVLDEMHKKSSDYEKQVHPVIAEHGEDAIKKSPHGRIVILGDPGTGKTTTLQHLVSGYAKEALENASTLSTPFMPLYLSLADLARSEKTFQGYLRDLVESMMIDEIYADELWATIQRGHAFVALDSLDEVAPAHRPRMIKLVNTLALERGNIWVVGSRFTEYKGGQLRIGQFTEWELLSMTAPLRRELAEKLLPELYRLLKPEAAVFFSSSDFVSLLEKQTQTRAWEENPLLFSLAAVVFVNTGGLPASRASLYREVIEAILTLREADGYTRNHLLRVLTGLSLWLHQEKRGRTFTLNDMFTFLEDIQQRSWSEVDALVKKLTNSGILDLVAHQTYGFHHQTFQEYLAAVELARQLTGSEAGRKAAWDMAWSKRTYSRWTEVLRLMVGVLTQTPGKTGYIKAIRWLDQLVEQRETEEGDPGDLNLILALTSLVEIVNEESWEAGKTRTVAHLQTRLVSLWVQEFLDAVRQQRRARRERFKKLTTDVAHLRLLEKDVISKQLIQALRDTATETLKKLRFSGSADSLLLSSDPFCPVRQAAVEILSNQEKHSPLGGLLPLLDDPFWPVRQAAVEILGKQGERTPLDRLLPLLDDPFWPVRQAAVEILGKQGERTPLDRLLPLLDDPNSDVRQAVVEVLGQQGECTPLDRLLPLLDDPSSDVRRAVVRALGKQGERTPLDRLLPLLENPDSLVRQAAAEILGQQGERTPLDRLLPLLDDPDWWVRQTVVRALGQQGERTPLDRLLPLLNDPDSHVQQAAEQVLGQQGERTLLDRLLPLLDDPDSHIRQAAAEILGQQGGRTLLDRLLPLLDDPDSHVRRATVEALGKQGERTPLDRLLPLLNDPDSHVRRATVEALGQQGERTPLDRLLPLLDDPDWWVRRAAVEALGKQGERTPLDRLLPLLDDPDSIVQQTAERVLGKHEEQKILDRMLTLLDDPSWPMQQAITKPVGLFMSWTIVMAMARPMRQAIVRTLVWDQMHNQDERTLLDRLLPLLENPSWSVRRVVVQVLSSQGERTPLDRLLPLLNDPDSHVRQAVVEALGSQGERTPLDRLLPLLDDPSSNVRQAVVEALGKQDERTPLDRLLLLLDDPDAHVRQAVVEALGKQGERTPLDRLLPLLNDPTRLVQQTAEQVLGKQDERTPLDRLLPLLENPSWSVRRATVEALGKQGERTPLDRLLPLLDDPDAHVRQAVVRFLGKQGERTPLDRLLPLLDDPYWWVRRAVVEALGQQGERTPLDRLLPLLDDPDSNICQAAVEALGSQGERTPLDHLLPLLENPYWWVRRAVVRALGKQGERTPLDRLLPLLDDPSSDVRQAVVEALGSQGERTPLDRLLPLLDDPASCRAVVEALGSQGERTPLDRLLPLLDDPDSHVRRATVEALGKQRERTPLDRLLPLLNDPSSDVRQAVVQTFKAHKEQITLILLTPFFYCEEAGTRQAAVEILEVFDEPIPTEILIDLLSDEYGTIRQTTLGILKKQSPHMLADIASQALSVLDGQTIGTAFPTLIQMHVADIIGELGIVSTLALEKLTELLDWPHWQVRRKAIQALGKLRRNIPDRAIQRLLILRRDSDPKMRALREVADDALAEILSLETGIEDD